MNARRTDVLILGGGVAGLATALACADLGRKVTLLEARKKLGGRAASWTDRTSGQELDHCQHVVMGCCTNFLDFAERVQIAREFSREERLHFLDPEGIRSDFAATPLVPAPLHLATSFLGLKYLSWSDRIAVARAVLDLARDGVRDDADNQSMGAWLRAKQQSPLAIERFWQVVLVSALGESLERSSLASARKVFVDGLLGHPRAGDVLIPKVPLRFLFDVRAPIELASKGVTFERGTTVRSIEGSSAGVERVIVERGQSGQLHAIDCSATNVVLAAPWHLAASLLSQPLQQLLPQVVEMASVPSSAISGVHLWFDQPITPLRHAVLVGRLSQWLFAPNFASVMPEPPPADEHYYQVVISASRSLVGRAREAVIEEVRADLAAVFPRSRAAKLLRWQLVSEQDAVFSVLPGLAAKRPTQLTRVPGLYLAGDWTRTEWPATLEGAVRSGYLAAEAIERSRGSVLSLLRPDLPKNWLARTLLHVRS